MTITIWVMNQINLICIVNRALKNFETSFQTSPHKIKMKSMNDKENRFKLEEKRIRKSQ